MKKLVPFAALVAAGPLWAQSELEEADKAPASTYRFPPIVEHDGPVPHGPVVRPMVQPEYFPLDHVDDIEGLTQTAEVEFGPKAERLGPAGAARMRPTLELTEVLHMVDPDGVVWARGQNFKTSYDGSRFEFMPKATSAPDNQIFGFELTNVSLGGEPILFGADTATRFGDQIVMPRGAFDEVYLMDLDGVEQTYVFDSLPGSGELVVSQDVSFAEGWYVTEVGDNLVFRHDTYGEVTYGAAFLVDAMGVKTPIERAWTGSGIELRVAADVVANAALPFTIDPRVTALTVSQGGDEDESNPDICWDGRQNQYWIAIQDYWSATDTDVYVTPMTTGGTQGALVTIDFTTHMWRNPKIGYHWRRDILLCAATTNENAPGDSTGQCEGVRVDASAEATLATSGSTQFAISTCCFDKINVDVGGCNFDLATNAHFCVCWEFLEPGGDGDIQYRVVDWDGSFVTAVTNVDNSSTDHDTQCAISDSEGDLAAVGGDFWCITWIRDNDMNGFGTPWARYVVFNGNTALGGGNFSVFSTNFGSNPSVTSQLDEPVSGSDKPVLVAFERNNPLSAPGAIWVSVVSEGVRYGPGTRLSVRDDVDPDLDRVEPSIATDGDCFYLAFSEEYYGCTPGCGDFDIYYCSGHVAFAGGTSYSIGLAERHENLAFSTSAEMQPVCATLQDGESSTGSDDGVCIFIDNTSSSPNGGRIDGYTLECPTQDVNSTTNSVGRQYCVAQPHSESQRGDRLHAWLWLQGNTSLGTSHRINGINLPQDEFCHMLGGMGTGLSVNPGGSMGNLCLVGAPIGRFLTTLQNTGNAGFGQGSFTAFVNPQNLASPTGPVAAVAGETWNFQVWFRDRDPGVVSNFTNAVGVTFTP